MLVLQYFDNTLSFAIPEQSFIERAGPDILAETLPVKTEYVIQLKLDKQQESMYLMFLEELRKGGYSRQLFRDFEVRAQWAGCSHCVK